MKPLSVILLTDTLPWAYDPQRLQVVMLHAEGGQSYCCLESRHWSNMSSARSTHTIHWDLWDVCQCC